MNLNPLEALREQARDWAAKVRELIDTPVPAHLVTEKNALISFAKKIKDTLESILGTVDEFAPMQLGFLQFVAAAAIAAAAAAVTKWMLDYKKFKEKLGAYNKLTSAGIPANQAATIVSNLDQQRSLLSFNGASLPLLLLAGGGIYLLSR